MNTLRVLSIDMDFFQQVDYSTLIECYPDGHDYSSYLSTLVWSMHYINPYERPRLDKVTCPEDLLDALKLVLKKQHKNIPIYVSTSHLHIYNFIHDQFAKNKPDYLEIVNIDMHHDMFTDCLDTINCGNWAHHIIEELPTKFTWISNEVSDEAMDYSIVPDLEDVDIVKSDFQCIEDSKFDVIFLCRSDAWYPPHLDNKFSGLVSFMQSIFHNVYVSDKLGNREQSLVDIDIVDSLRDVLKYADAILCT